jgi:hypothetical protein
VAIELGLASAKQKGNSGQCQRVSADSFTRPAHEACQCAEVCRPGRHREEWAWFPTWTNLLGEKDSRFVALNVIMVPCRHCVAVSLLNRCEIFVWLCVSSGCGRGAKKLLPDLAYRSFILYEMAYCFLKSYL